MADNRSSFIPFMMGFLIGGLVSAVFSLLNAPSSGDETREQIKAKGVELRNRADGEVERLRAQAQEMLAGIRTRADESQARIVKQIDDLQSRMSGAIDKGKEGIQAVQEELVGSTSDGES